MNLEAQAQHPPRLIVLTDMSSLTAGVREVDDAQSMIRLMLYTNDIEIEGLIASSSLRHGQVVRPELIRRIVQAYGQVRPNLILHDTAYPTAAYLLGRIKAGQPLAGPDVPVFESIGEGKSTEASRWIVEVVDQDDPRPVWVTAWGGTADLAQALWTVRHTRRPAAVEAFVSKLRAITIGDQDATGQWIRAEFPHLFYITRHLGFRGMYRGGDTALVSSDWVETHIRNGHGALGALYPNYDGGDPWVGELGRVRGIKEGDTPSFLSLIPNGLNVPSEPTWGGWGGLFKQVDAHRYTDAVDPYGDYATAPDPRMAAVYRWRPAFQHDFQARLDWCVQPYDQANHRPAAFFDGDGGRNVVYLNAEASETVSLNAAGSNDPDGDDLSYHWFVYEAAGTYRGTVSIDGSTAQNASFTAPTVGSPQTLHVILKVTDNGQPPLTSYRRIVVTVDPI